MFKPRKSTDIQSYLDELCEKIGERLREHDERIDVLQALVKEAIKPNAQSESKEIVEFQLLDPSDGEVNTVYWVDYWEERNGLITLNVAYSESEKALGMRKIKWPYYRVRPLREDEKRELRNG